jgi:hypothetical protein
VTAHDVFNARSRLEVAEAGSPRAQRGLQGFGTTSASMGDINARRKAAQDTLYDARLNVEYC